MAAGNDITNLIRFIRMDTGDDGTTQTYSDLQLVTTVQKATIRVDGNIGAGLTQPVSGGFVQFAQAASGSTFLPSGIFGLPDGAFTANLPDNLLNLILLKSECLLAKRAHFDSAGKAIRVRDGDTEIDTSVGFGGLEGLTVGAGGPCAEYDKALEEYLKWLQASRGDDVTDYAAIIWKGSVRKTASHVEEGIHGNSKIERLADFSDYLTGDYGSTDTSRDAGQLGPDSDL